MSDIVTFLKGRLDEEEMAALAPSRGPWWWSASGEKQYPQTIYGRADDGATALVAETFCGPVDGTGLTRSPHEAEHIAYWNPTRILAEIAAKRAILGQATRFAHHPDWCGRWTGLAFDEDESCTCGGAAEAEREIALIFAQPFAEHEDFDPAWRT